MADKKKKVTRHPDAMKRARQAERRNLRNKAAISRIKTLRRAVNEATTPEAREAAARAAVSAIAKAGRKGVLHRRNASRLVSRISRKRASK